MTNDYEHQQTIETLLSTFDPKGKPIQEIHIPIDTNGFVPEPKYLPWPHPPNTPNPGPIGYNQ